jgi:hypothetical protein
MKSLSLVVAALVGVVGCSAPGEATRADAAPMPMTATCADASQLNDQAVDARRRSTGVTGDRAKIISGSRAKFLASLAAIAQLKCRTDVPETDAMLGRALEVARVAQTTSSEYEAAIRWIEADLIAADAIALMISQIPASPSR